MAVKVEVWLTPEVYWSGHALALAVSAERVGGPRACGVCVVDVCTYI